ncbi:MAG: hypothetical protein Q8K93_24795 [Reyranella sp.]|uniref:hypothetical protein n=1 Tax=Reyranella sp. TaxID=1929291 RepID=UPI002731E3A1|nr:hypothetical protein [Reyranella sp.]MDP1965417.1 hypothetical protein [Reyranella sp.]MDP2376397.1 hypothetical protein [Reyranella sp.]
MTDIVEELRAQGHRTAREGDLDLLIRAAAEIERLRRATAIAWQPMQSAPKDEGPLLLFCPGLSGHVANEIVVGAWQFDENRRTFGYWTSDVGRLDLGFVETGPWIEYPELHPQRWARLPPRPGESEFI